MLNTHPYRRQHRKWTLVWCILADAQTHLPSLGIDKRNTDFVMFR